MKLDRPASHPMARIAAPVVWRHYLGFLRDPVRAMAELCGRHGRLIALDRPLRLGRRTRPTIIAVGPEFNRQVLDSRDRFRTAGQFLLVGPPGSAMRRVRTGLTRMNGPEHDRNRKLVQPALQKPAVDNRHDRLVELTGELIGAWPVGQPVDVWQLLRHLTRSVAATALFGVDDTEEPLVIAAMIDRLLAIDHSPAVWLSPNLAGTPYRRMLQHAERLEQRIVDWIERRRAAPAGADLMSVLAHARDPDGRLPPARALAGQVTVMYTASYENVSNVLTWTLFLLAQHPAVAAELLDELDGSGHGALPAAEALGSLPLLDAVIRESMRLLTPVPYLVRVTLLNIELAGQRVPEGARVLLSPYLTHRLPELYAEAERFRPQRWFGLRPSGYEYLPFGAGPRHCVGSIFAVRLIKVALAMILQRYRLTVVSGARIDRRVTFAMAPKHGMPMSIHPQDRRFEAVAVRGDIREMVSFPEP